MNGFYPTNNYIGAIGEYPIYDYLKDNYISIATINETTGNLIYEQDFNTIIQSGNEIYF